jgi:hypothetical protein
LQPSKTFAGYRHALILFHDVAERDSAIKFYLKKRFPVNLEKNHSIMVNPWGCGRFPKLVSEDFLVEEIKACPELGATHYQIDDSWQQGGSLSEIIIKNRAVDAQFWKVADKLHGNFDRLVEVAKSSGGRTRIVDGSVLQLRIPGLGEFCRAGSGFSQVLRFQQLQDRCGYGAHL